MISKKSYLIGDRAKDISAGIKVGVKTIFLDNSYKEKKIKSCDFRVKSLKKVINII